MNSFRNTTMKKTGFLLTAVLALAAAFVSCGGGGGNNGGGINNAPIVHAVGYENNSQGIRIAKYWNNRGENQSLSNGQYDSEARGLFVADNGDVYASGYERRSTGDIIKVWKNGALLYNLTDGTTRASVTSFGIYVTPGGAVYVAAGVYDSQGGISRAKLWKDSVEQQYESNGRSSAFYSVCVADNGDVYVSGDELEYTPHAPSGYSLGMEVAKVWRNGAVLHRVNTNIAGLIGTIPYSVSVSGGNVYTAGAEYYYDFRQNSSGQWGFVNLGSIAKYWRNGVSQNLNLAGTGDSEAQSVHASGNDVCVAIYEYNSSGVEIAKYWKNGVLTNLGDGSLRTTALDIYGHRGNVYVVGGEVNPQTGYYVAKYWMNGQPHTISSGSYFALARRIVVK